MTVAEGGPTPSRPTASRRPRSPGTRTRQRPLVTDRELSPRPRGSGLGARPGRFFSFLSSQWKLTPEMNFLQVNRCYRQMSRCQAAPPEETLSSVMGKTQRRRARSSSVQHVPRLTSHAPRWPCWELVGARPVPVWFGDHLPLSRRLTEPAASCLSAPPLSRFLAWKLPGLPGTRQGTGAAAERGLSSDTRR